MIVLLLALLLCSPMLDNAYGGLWSYADESATLLLAVWAVFSRSSVKRERDMLLSLSGLVVFILISFIGNAMFGYQPSAFAILVDAFTCTKIFISYLAARIVLHSCTRCLSMFQIVGKIFVSCALIGLVLHVGGVIQLGSGREVFGVPCYQFLFSHPTNLAAYCVGFAAIFFAGERPCVFWLISTIVLLVSTQRAKAVAMAFVLAFFLLYCLAKKDDRRPSFLVFLPIIVGVVFLGADSVNEYFIEGSGARAMLLRDGFDIALRSFPLGSGFATFGSYMSGIYYSPLYYEYGLNTIWGLSAVDPSFVSDSFWPAVLAQSGVLGFAALVLVGVAEYRLLRKDARARSVRFIAYAAIPIYLFVLSTSDAAFFNYYGPFYALVLVSIVSRNSPNIKAYASGSDGKRTRLHRF